MKTTDQPINQSFHIEGVKHISVSDAFEALKIGDAVMLDVRELNEVQLESVPLDRVLNHPMSVIMDRLSYIAKDQNIIVACPGGVRSVKVANMLNLQGFPNVASLDGGFMLWKAKGMPMESNPSVGGCGCNSGIKTNAVDTILRTHYCQSTFEGTERFRAEKRPYRGGKNEVLFRQQKGKRIENPFNLVSGGNTAT